MEYSRRIIFLGLWSCSSGVESAQRLADAGKPREMNCPAVKSGKSMVLGFTRMIRMVGEACMMWETTLLSVRSDIKIIFLSRLISAAATLKSRRWYKYTFFWRFGAGILQGIAASLNHYWWRLKHRKPPRTYRGISVPLSAISPEWLLLSLTPIRKCHTIF